MEKLAYALVFIALMFAVLNIMTNQDKDEPPPRTARRKKPRPVEPHPAELPAETGGINTSSKSLAEKKGDVGEQIVKVAVLSKLDAVQYRHFSNLIIPASNGTTQIDNIVVSPFGVFVIEAKYFQGWILAARNRKNGRTPCRALKNMPLPTPSAKITGISKPWRGF